MLLIVPIVIVLLSCAQRSAAYPNGPPVVEHPSICTTLFPTGHNAEAQLSTARYAIIVSGSCYKSGTKLRARVKITDPNDERLDFEGFFIQARTANSNTASHGTFHNLDDPYMKTLDCFGSTDNAIGHADNRNYLARTFEWTAPSTNVGELRFVGTVLKGTATFWLDVQSSVITYDSGCTATNTLPEEEFGDFAKDDGCESSEEDCDENAGQVIIPMFTLQLLPLLYLL